MKQRMYDFLAELVPRSMRGKELGRGNYSMGAMYLLSVEYEHVTIVEPKDANQPFANNPITVSFKTNNCILPHTVIP
jgi:hypothetical protein